MTVEIACIMWSNRACGVFWDTDGHFVMAVCPFRSEVAEIPDMAVASAIFLCTLTAGMLQLDILTSMRDLVLQATL